MTKAKLLNALSNLLAANPCFLLGLAIGALVGTVTGIILFS